MKRQTEAGKRVGRVRVVDQPPTDGQRFPPRLRHVQRRLG
ncbi:DUF6879 family protein [Streptomyces sp. KL116D]